jgi:hypothetical protein
MPVSPPKKSERRTMKTYRLLVCALLVGTAVSLLVSSSVAEQLRTDISLVADIQERPQAPSPPRPAQATAKTTSFVIKPFFRISQASAVSADRRAGSAEVAYNPDDNEYLIVWESDGLTETKGINDIYGQRINAATLEPIGINFRISSLSDNDRSHSANDPKVIYNRTSHEYLVAWHGSGLFDGPAGFFEIYGQRLSRAGKEIGGDFQISHMTELGKINTSFVRSNSQVDIAWNSTSNEYLVIWKGMGEPDDVVKMEIYGQRLKANGELLGKYFRISHTTTQGDNFHANAPAIAYDSRDNQYLVVWSGGFKQESHTEVWGRGLSSIGAVLGTDDFRISQVSTSANRRASSPHLAYNSANNEFLVVFQANSLPGDTRANANEILGQRINATKLGEVEPTYLRVSNATEVGIRVSEPQITYNSLDKEYLVLWRSTRAKVPSEIWAQRLNASGADIEGDFQISNIGAAGQDRSINDAALTNNSTNGQYVVVWQGNALAGADSAKKYEIFGQQLVPARPPGK